jgi:HD-like signal output (HDOD) protein
MPSHLLFVDDEPMVLDGIRRALHCMRSEWDMQFVTSAAEALAALKLKNFDAIITDMRMPVMDGAQLLEQVKEFHPDLVRIVLSGQCSKEAILRTIAPAHQILSKPCDLQELKARLSQAFVTRGLLRNPALASIVARLRSIPSLPTLYTELTVALRDENTSLLQIEQIVSKDVGMAAKILQLANSAFMGAHGRRVSSLRDAMSLIGAETVRSLTLSIHVFSQFDRKSAVAQYLPCIWDHSVAVASLAQRIAATETRNKLMAEESFTTGLLHDVGKIVLLAEMPKDYLQALQHLNTDNRSIRDLEIEFTGCPHEQVGAYLMSIWGLPESIVQAVEYHHRPIESGQTTFSPLTALHCADAIASATDKSPMNRDIELNRDYLQTLGLLEKEGAWRALGEDCATSGDGDRAFRLG